MQQKVVAFYKVQLIPCLGVVQNLYRCVQVLFTCTDEQVLFSCKCLQVLGCSNVDLCRCGLDVCR